MQPYYERSGIRLYHGDCREVVPSLGEQFAAVVTDPPYGLSFMGRDWDHAVPGVAFWEAFRDAMLPGAHLLAFGGSRTYHRIAVAIEDAGFEIRDTLQWLYGSGFPKSLDVSKAIDKRGGRPDLAAQIGAAIKAARERRGMSATECDRIFCDGTTNWSWFEGRPAGQRAPTPETFRRIVEQWPELAEYREMVAEVEREVIGNDTKARSTSGKSALPTMGGETVYESWDITAPATDAAREWQGWGTALKPAYEPIILARKPLSGTVAQTVLAHGTGALNIDGTRVGTSGGTARGEQGERMKDAKQGFRANGIINEIPAGRWPPNLLMDETAAALLDQMSGELGKSARPNPKRRGTDNAVYGKHRDTPFITHRDSHNGASRFFPVLPIDDPDTLRFLYTPKASRRERNAGLDGLPERDAIVAHTNGCQVCERCGIKYANSITACSCGGTLTRTQTINPPRANHHPTVKPLALMRWLLTLVTPPGGTVLDPFAGSGTTGVAAAQLGIPCVLIEQEAEYLPIIAGRIDHALNERAGAELPLFAGVAD